MAALPLIGHALRALLLGMILILGPWIHVALAIGIVYGLARLTWRTARRYRPVPPSLLVIIIVAGIMNTGPDLLQAAVSMALCLAYAGFSPKERQACHVPA